VRRAIFSKALTTGALAACVLASGSLTPDAAWARARPPAEGAVPVDPWEKFNRGVYAFNQKIDKAILVPLSKLTRGLTPGPLGRAIHNFLVNLNEPVVMVNDLLQAKPGRAIRSAFRLVVNSTIGGLGAIDVAKALGQPAHKNGFGDTLGRWGAVPGPYMILPVLGPATVRDVFGSIVDDLTLPLQIIDYPYRLEVDVTVSIVGGLNERSEVGPELDALLAGAADPYATLRSSYLQAREAQIRGEKALPPLPEIEEAIPPPEAPPGPDSTNAVPHPDAAGPSADSPPSPPSGAGPSPPEAGDAQGGVSSAPQGDGDPDATEAPESLPEETRL
jgi:phospholipid-binding lipoprotein MlaA